MGRIILGVIVGFVVWSILWVGGDEAFGTLSANWYGPHKLAFEKAAFNNTPFEADSMILLFKVVHSLIASLISGYVAVLISNENRRTTMVLGVLLLIVGIAVQASVWSLLPIWYHLIFLALLIPMTIVGGKLKKTT